MASNAGTVVIRLDADSQKLLAELRKAGRSTQRFGKTQARQLRKVERQWKAVGSAVASIVVSGVFAQLTRQALASVDALAKTADKLGVTTEALAGLRLAGQLTGNQINTTDMALQRMTRRIAEAAQGSGEAKGALAELGLDAAKLAQLPLDQQFFAVADAMQAVESQSDRVRLSFKLFDSEGVALVNTLRGGSAALIDARKRAEQLGLAISRVDAARIEQANNAIVEMRGAFAGVGNLLAVQLAPVITGLAKTVTDSIADADGFRDAWSGSITTVAVATAGLVNTFNIFRKSILGIQLLLLSIERAQIQAEPEWLQRLAEITEPGSFGRDLVESIFGPVSEAGEDATDEIQQLNAAIADVRTQLDATRLVGFDEVIAKFEEWRQAADESFKATQAAAGAVGAVTAPSGLDTGALAEALAAQQALDRSSTELAVAARNRAADTAAAVIASGKSATTAQLAAQQQLAREAVTIATRQVQEQIALDNQLKTALGQPPEAVGEIQVRQKVAARAREIYKTLAADVVAIDRARLSAALSAEAEGARLAADRRLEIQRGVTEQVLAQEQQLAASRAQLAQVDVQLRAADSGGDLEAAQALALQKAELEAQVDQVRLANIQAFETEATRIAVEEATRRVEARLAAEAQLRESLGLPATPQDQLAQQQAIAEESQGIYQGLLDARVAAEESAATRIRAVSTQTENYIRSQKQQTLQLSVQLLQAFAGKSKLAAIAVIAVEKGLAIAQTIMSGAAAELRAMAELGPIAGPPMVAKIRALTAANVALIAATGIAQATSTVGGGGAAVGTPANPAFTQPAETPTPDGEGAFGGREAVQLVFQGDVYGWDDYIQTKVVAGIQDAVRDRDVVLIADTSRNAIDIQSGG